ncbi:MAG: PRC-barrel domain containing protein [Gammaproteobacteria bacterium]|nr:MAG: PRC-barrel domain containing protein [Gammaproteobacteria bacterium]
MKKLNKFAMCALVLPVGAFAAGGAYADSPQHESDSPHSQHETSSQQSQHGASHQGGMKSDQARQGMYDTAKKPEYMSSTPDDAVRVDNVIGSTLYGRSNDERSARAGDEPASRSNGKELGTIDDLIIDESGQIVAVVLSVGGVLGMGESTVAISWDAVERTMNEDRDGYEFSVDKTEDDLRNAPSYDKDSDGIRTSSSSESNW